MTLSKYDDIIFKQLFEAINYILNEFNSSYLCNHKEYIYYSNDNLPNFMEISNKIINNLIGSTLITVNNKYFIIIFNNYYIKCFLYDFNNGINVIKYIEICIDIYRIK